MAGLIPPEKLLEIQQASDIVEIISGYTPLKKAGTVYKALCPFHKEKTPSFVVWPKTQIFKCFGCDAKGNVIGFVQKAEKLGFPDAVKMLAERAGIRLQRSQASAEQEERKSDLYKAMEWAAEQYQAALRGKAGAQALEYLAGRGISEAMINRFRLGFAPLGWTYLHDRALQAGYTRETLTRVGLVVERREGPGLRDKFVNRVMFPICDTRGRVIAFGGRVLDDGIPKYLNSPETEIFKKRQGVYALNFAKDGIIKQDKAVIVEGYTDTIMAHQHGQDYVVATLGTALTAEQAHQLNRFSKNIVLVFDSDTAGQNAADRSLDVFFEENIDVRIASVPSGKDPCDFIKENGGEAFAGLVDASADIIDFKLARAKAGRAMESVIERKRIITELLSLLAKLQDPVKVDLYMMKVVAATGVQEAHLRNELTVLKRGGNEQETRATPGASKSTLADKAERTLVSMAVTRPDMFDVIRDIYPPDAFKNRDYARIFEKLIELAGMERNVTATASQLAALLEDDALQNLVVELERDGETIIHAGAVLEECLDSLETHDIANSRGPRAKALVVENKGRPEEDEHLARFQQALAAKPAHRRKNTN